MADEVRILVSASEQDTISRTVRRWLSSYEDLPASRLDFEYLGKTSGLTISTIQAAYKTRRYITGGYQAQYQFQIVYRVMAANADERLSADEELNAMAEWAEENPPELPEGINRWKVRRDTDASTMTRYDNGAEDHAIQMTIIYEVI